ncbi:MAG: hypothetical protein CMJ19_02805 [Phycisphaeraceae bacterium]|nr:hypothetical protein [Phycisphaeraceae bacterium]
MIFSDDIVKCEICRVREAEKGKQRCTYCKGRYDSNGVAFVVYCYFWKFRKGKKDLTFWVSDDKVQKAPVPFTYLVGKNLKTLTYEMAEQSFEWVETDEPIFK